MTDITQISKKKKRSLLQVILSSGLFASLSTALIAYINSSFLETLIPKSWIGILFAIAYACSFFAIQNYALAIQRFKNYKVLLAVLSLEIATLLLLAWNINPIVSIIAFIVLVVSYNVTVVNYDLFLEGVSQMNDTGRIRGIFWTATNLGWLLGPFLSGILVGYSGFSMAYFVSALFLIPAWILIFYTYRNHKRIHFKPHHSLMTSVKQVLANKNLRGIYLVALVLYLFYSWMVIYTPIYLIEIGFSWEEIGSIFTVMLIPFVLIEYPAGWLADKLFGETEMLTIGFSIMGLSVIGLLFATGYWWVMIVLFISRIGAALVEIMRDVYFYKKVNEEDLDLIDLFRNMRSISYIIGPLLASAILAFGYGIEQIFVVLAIVLFLATIIPFYIEDTL